MHHITCRRRLKILGWSEVAVNASISKTLNVTSWRDVFGRVSSRRKTRQQVVRYGVAVLAAVAGLLFREALKPLLGHHNPYHVAWFTVVFSAWYCGLWPSILTLIIETLGVWYWFLPIHNSWQFQDRNDVYGLIGFVLLGGVIVALGEMNRRTVSRKTSAEERAQRAKTLFETFMDNSPARVYLKDEDGRYVYANAADKARFNPEIIGKTVFDLYPHLIAAQLHEHDLLVLEENKAHEFIENTVEADGEHTWISIKFPVIDTEGRRLLGGKSIDITERKRAEDAVVEARSELENRVKERTQELTIAEEAARKLSGRILTLQDEERRRIAKGLHDSLGQYLAALKMNLDSFPSPTRAQAAAVSDCSEIVEKCLTETRTISHLLHPPMLDEAGFGSAARWYVEGFGRRSGIGVNLDLPQELKRLHPDMEIALFRALQESLTNVHKHANSSLVDIRLTQDAKQVRLEIQDDGRGIPKERLKRLLVGSAEVGVGIAGMRERFRELGGSVELRSGKKGTTVIVTAPMPQGAMADSMKDGESTRTVSAA
jgi:PAS domain S-box-containing protein